MIRLPSRTSARTVIRAFVPMLLLLVAPASAVENRDQPPSTTAPKGPRPSTLLRQLAAQKPPELVGKGEDARKNAVAFVGWAGASTAAQDDLVRKSIAAARDNRDAMSALCDEAFSAQTSDHSRALVVLSLLGEARSRYGEECLIRFVRQPLPEKGTVVEGEIVEQTALAMLQAKAIDGLAYLRTESADRVVLEMARDHPSRIVRAEAIAAYLWNRQSSVAAREALRPHVRDDERIFLDRVVREDGERRESFNRKLAIYRKNHPETRPPAPQKARPQPRPRPGTPPVF